MIILQISPEFTAGTGVGGVAEALEAEWRSLGHDVRRFSLSDAGGAWLDGTDSGLRGQLRHVARVVWFSTVGTVRARKTVRELPDGAISICHNDALSGSVYVNHGVLQSAMRARGNYWWRMVRNPVHLFTAGRDQVRYQGQTHRVVVNLTSEDDQALRQIYPRLRPPTKVIGNGVNTERFRPPTTEERRTARTRLELSDEAILSIFIGNEYERKGLFPLMDAVAGAGDRHHLVVVGGTSDMTSHLATLARARGIDHRCHIVGKSDPLPYLWAADLLAQPSSYESYGLVVTEALATGVPVLSTRVGVAPDIIEGGVNGYLTDGTAKHMVAVLRELEHADLDAMRAAARESALDLTWSRVAHTYLELFATLTGVGVT